MSPSLAITSTLKQKGAAAVQDLSVLGLSRPTLFRTLKALERSGQIVKLRRGVYAHATGEELGDSWTLALQRHPKGVLCLLSALMYHQLTTQAPSAVWLALPKGARPPAPGYPVIKAVYLSGASYATGIQSHSLPEGDVRVYSVA
jgi:predicted transcriptional regulator of viral defense system